MVMKRLIGFVFAGALAFSALAAEIVVKVAPPKIVVENRGTRPSPRHVWIQGYHNWDGQKYVWTAGRWEVPPQGAQQVGSPSLGSQERRICPGRGALAVV